VYFRQAADRLYIALVPMHSLSSFIFLSVIF